MTDEVVSFLCLFVCLFGANGKSLRTGNEAEREPLPALVDSCAEVAAVLALRCNVLVAFEDGGEGVCAASEDEGHGGSCLWCRKARFGGDALLRKGSLSYF